MNQDLKDKGYLDRILSVRGDGTGVGGPMQILMQNGVFPVGEKSFFKFSLQSKNDLYLNFEQALFGDRTDPMSFSYPADHPLTAEFEDQMTKLIREYAGHGEWPQVHHPDEPDAKDDAPDSTALALFGALSGSAGEILFG